MLNCLPWFRGVRWSLLVSRKIVGIYVGPKRLIVVAVVLGLTLHAGRSAEVRKEFSGGVSIKGDIVFGDDLKFRSIVRGMPKAVVFLESPGGNPIVAIAIGRIIRARSFDTQITTGTCASACGLIWLAGKHRGIGPTGRVGFHGTVSPCDRRPAPLVVLSIEATSGGGRRRHHMGSVRGGS